MLTNTGKIYTQNPPLVSAVIPTHKRSELVCRAVRSVLDQTFRDLEIIVVVDGPDPAAVQALATFNDERIRVIVNPENVGLAETRNIGIRHARGKWIALLDDDDQWLPTKIEKQMVVAKTLDENHSFVVSRFVELTGTRRPLSRIIPKYLPRSASNFSDYLYVQRGFIQPSTLLISRQLLLAVPFTRGLRIEDTDWLLRATKIH